MTEYIIAVDYDTLTGTITKTKCEEIVRCRDCLAMRVKYGNTGIECWMSGEPFTVEPDGFCAWGERRSDDREREAQA